MTLTHISSQKSITNHLHSGCVHSDEVVVVEATHVVVVVNVVVHFDLVAQKAANTTEALAELVAVGRFVRDELDVDTELLVVEQEPVRQVLTTHNVQLRVGFWVIEKLGVFILCLVLGQDVHRGFICVWVSKLIAFYFQIFPEQHRLQCA